MTGDGQLGDITRDSAAELDSAEHDAAELDDADEYPPHEVILDEWARLGWFGVLPTAAANLADLFDDVTIAWADIPGVETFADDGLIMLDDNPLWPVSGEERYDDVDDVDGVDDEGQPRYDEYISAILTQRERWDEMVSQQPDLAVSTLPELVAKLVEFGLLADDGDIISLIDDEELPSPADLLPLSEQALAELAMGELNDDVELVLDELHDFLYHSDDTEMVVRLGQLAANADVDVEAVRLALALLVADSDSGVTAHRRLPSGPVELDASALETMAEHAKFTLRANRSAAGFAAHGH